MEPFGVMRPGLRSLIKAYRRKDILKLSNYSYGYKPIGVSHFGQVHVS